MRNFDFNLLPLLTIKIFIMKKSVKDYHERALGNLGKVRGGGEDSPVDRDKIKFPKNGKG